MEILPAIMPDSYGDLKDKALRVAGLVHYAQIDIMDGNFVPSVSWPYKNNMEEEGLQLPFLDQLRYEVDLMVRDPIAEVRTWINTGVSRILFHIESVSDPLAVIEEISLQAGDERKIEAGVAIDIMTENEKLEPLLSRVSVVQCMGIARIGYQGEPFDERVIQKIRELRKKHPEIIISVDGGVTFLTAPLLIEAGATRLVSGSAIFQAENSAEVIQRFQNL